MPYPHTRQIQNRLNSLYTVQDLCRGFAVTAMTIHLWREKEGLPTIKIKGAKRPSIRFAPKDIKRWARERRVEWAA